MTVVRFVLHLLVRRPRPGVAGSSAEQAWRQSIVNSTVASAADDRLV
jgi:hypothetical protein